MRKIILNLAISLDGYICDENGGFDWIVGHGDTSNDTEKVFDFETFTNSVDTVVMGSVAYEDCVLSGLDTYEGKQLVIATSRTFEPAKNTRFINGNITDYILDLRNEEGKDIWLFGGACSTDAFIKEDIIDQYIIGVIPTILGKGRRLFKENNPKIDLHLDDCIITDGITLLFYTKRA